MPFPVLAAGVVMGAMREQQERKRAKRREIADILKERAQAAGAPTYGVRAAEFQERQREEAPNYAGDLIGRYMKAQGGDPGTPKADDEDEFSTGYRYGGGRGGY